MGSVCCPDGCGISCFVSSDARGGMQGDRLTLSFYSLRVSEGNKDREIVRWLSTLGVSIN
jgi:hypothetical protein